MPLYEYHCADCEKNFELLMREQTVLACPSCQGTHLEKQLSVFAVGANGASATTRAAAASPCGACGDPRGPGACSMD